VEIEFKDKRLAKIENGNAADLAASGVPLEIIDRLRSRLELLRSAPDERTIRNWKSLHYEKLKGDRDGERSIRLNKKWRLIFTIDENRNPKTIVILKVEDYH
jgi:proteic killer suppression protein